MDSLTTRFEKEVFMPYLDILKAEYRFHSIYAHARSVWEEKLTSKELVNGPYLEKAQVYETGDPLESLSLHEQTIKTICKRLGEKRNLYRHQTDALKLLLSGKNAVIATGTSSGKTLCYQIPILDDLISNPAPGLRAVIIYPLNALVNDQLTEWEEMLKHGGRGGFPGRRRLGYLGPVGTACSARSSTSWNTVLPIAPWTASSRSALMRSAMEATTILPLCINWIKAYGDFYGVGRSDE